ncbi:unnamed protein product [Amoebophrya sp. A120]|nr:unnamed protein product [Amoebophrya sp. A120]|eukprot:GSA120T00002424001.1
MWGNQPAFFSAGVGGTVLPPAVSRYLIGNHELEAGLEQNAAGVWTENGDAKVPPARLQRAIDLVQRTFGFVVATATAKSRGAAAGATAAAEVGGREDAVSNHSKLSPSDQDSTAIPPSSDQKTSSASNTSASDSENRAGNASSSSASCAPTAAHSEDQKSSKTQPGSSVLGAVPTTRGSTSSARNESTTTKGVERSVATKESVISSESISSSDQGSFVFTAVEGANSSAKTSDPPILDRIPICIPDWYNDGGTKATLRRRDILSLGDFLALVLSNRFSGAMDVLEDFLGKQTFVESDELYQIWLDLNTSREEFFAAAQAQSVPAPHAAAGGDSSGPSSREVSSLPRSMTDESTPDIPRTNSRETGEQSATSVLVSSGTKVVETPQRNNVVTLNASASTTSGSRSKALLDSATIVRRSHSRPVQRVGRGVNASSASPSKSRRSASIGIHPGAADGAADNCGYNAAGAAPDEGGSGTGANAMHGGSSSSSTTIGSGSVVNTASSGTRMPRTASSTASGPVRARRLLQPVEQQDGATDPSGAPLEIAATARGRNAEIKMKLPGFFSLVHDPEPVFTMVATETDMQGGQSASLVTESHGIGSAGASAVALTEEATTSPIAATLGGTEEPVSGNDDRSATTMLLAGAGTPRQLQQPGTAIGSTAAASSAPQGNGSASSTVAAAKSSVASKLHGAPQPPGTSYGTSKPNLLMRGSLSTPLLAPLHNKQAAGSGSGGKWPPPPTGKFVAMRLQTGNWSSVCRSLLQLFLEHPGFANQVCHERSVVRVFREVGGSMVVKECPIKIPQLVPLTRSLDQETEDRVEGTFTWKENQLSYMFAVKKFYATAHEIYVSHGSDQQAMALRLFRYLRANALPAAPSVPAIGSDTTTAPPEGASATAGALASTTGGNANPENATVAAVSQPVTTPVPSYEDPLNKKYFVGQGNNPGLIEQILQDRGFTPATSSKKPCFPTFQWAQDHGRLDFSLLSMTPRLLASKGKGRPYLANHCKGIRITEKVGMLASLEQEFGWKNLPPWYPKTFHVLSLASSKNVEQLDLPADARWVYKPRASNCGRGIMLFSSTKALRDYIATEKKTDGIVQLYIERPLLVQGRKFDIRMYFLVARTQPFLSFYCPHGYCRLCVNPYESANFDDLTMHLTNQAIQKTLRESYQETKEDTTWTFAQLEEHLVETARVNPGWVAEEFLPKVKLILVALSRIVRAQVMPLVGCFDLFGCDFFLDDALNVYLFEVNSNPAIYTDTAVLKNLIPAVIRETIDIVDRAHVPNNQKPFSDQQWFETLIDESRNFQFGPERLKPLSRPHQYNWRT